MTPIAAPSPNFDARVKPPDMIVLHYTGMPTGEAALARLRDPAARVSAHYLVEEDGRVFTLVAEERRAWHAGKSFWQGERDVNAASFPDTQVDAVLDLVADIRGRWSVPDGRIVGHSDVAPDRKEDPGELFPWKRLAEAGHGLWAEPAAAPGGPLKEGDDGAGVFALQAGLTRLGYDSAPSGAYDAATAAIVRAFQRHWRPSLVDGAADGETRARLIALLRLAA
jgi:N-acetylmuramoyl-L-alanine amidase